jgi:hypothetical protein
MTASTTSCIYRAMHSSLIYEPSGSLLLVRSRMILSLRTFIWSRLWWQISSSCPPPSYFASIYLRKSLAVLENSQLASLGLLLVAASSKGGPSRRPSWLSESQATFAESLWRITPLTCPLLGGFCTIPAAATMCSWLLVMACTTSSSIPLGPCCLTDSDGSSSKNSRQSSREVGTMKMSATVTGCTQRS